MTTHTRGGTTKVEVRTEMKPEQLVRLGRIGRELRLTGQMLSDDLDAVTITDEGPAAAWTTLDGDEVSFSMKHMPHPVSRVDVAVWLGTFAHELGHNLFSPRTGSRLMLRVIEGEATFMRGIAQIHNIVEDQRQERLILARFAPWRTYLVAALGHHLTADADTAWVLLAGRTWLAANLRADARAKFVAAFGGSSASEVAVLVGRYQDLTDPGDTESQEAWEILEALHNLLGSAATTMKGPKCRPMRGGEPDTSQPGEGAPETAEEADAEGDEPGEGEGEGDSSDESDDDAEGGGNGAGSETATPKEQREQLKRKIKDAARNEINKDQDAAGELDDVLDALRNGRPGDGAEGGDPVGSFETASDAARLLHREVGDALLDLKDDSEPGWVKRCDSGRLSVRRLATGAAAEELFDRYEPGQMDASELEVVLLLDVSGSMQGEVQRLAEATWAIRQAVDDIEGTCTVITWDSGPHRVLAAPGVRPDDRMFVPMALGGTSPTSALGEAFRVLADSQARNRLAVILTDGAWFEVWRSHQIIDAMNEAGVTTVCALLGGGAGDDLHHCEHGRKIAAPADLARLFRDVAASKIGAW